MTATTLPAVCHRIAADLAEVADAEARTRHPQLGRAAAELGLVYLAFVDQPPTGPHGLQAWQAAEAARYAVREGSALNVSADTARARLHLALDALDHQRQPAAEAAA
ncbi:hypothetical protein G5C51_04390 [Streptomyces sp. A7024]|uniref:Uncharacterized protein n=1 Tax=Streptomyces coryli TaxID=1128680 RepID=A0A6G4TUL1_9ACTN|nr:hypothetical protein [Streptomyces coryli]NGN63146.1 hypothetical protein [Streptomyces coryli]